MDCVHLWLWKENYTYISLELAKALKKAPPPTSFFVTKHHFPSASRSALPVMSWTIQEARRLRLPLAISSGLLEDAVSTATSDGGVLNLVGNNPLLLRFALERLALARKSRLRFLQTKPE
jgi:hypothetical protein